MTAFVMDASVTAAWLLPDMASEHTRRLYAAIRRDEVEPRSCSSHSRRRNVSTVDGPRSCR